MPQPWRTFVVVINRCISGKSTSLDRLRPSRAQILWGMFNKKNVDFVALLWEDFMLQADNKDISQTCKENMSYPRFTKVIINHFIYKDKTISMRNSINLHTIRDDSLLGTLKYVSKTDDYQKYGALIPDQMINQAIQDSKAYKIYLSFATRKATPKKARKFKKIALPSKKQTLEDISSKKPSRKKSIGVQIKETPNVYVSKEKASTTTDRSKGIDLLSEVALLEDAQLKKALKRSKRYITIHQAGGSSEGFDSELKVPSEPKGYVPTEDKTNDETKEFDEEEYEELYGDVNISLTDVEPTDKEKGDVKMTNTETVDADLEKVNPEGACNQVNDDAQATQKTEVPLPSSFISSDYVAKYLNFDNIPPVDTEVLSMLDVNVQHEFPQATTSTTAVPDFETLSAFHQRITKLEKDVKEIKTVDHSVALLSTIKSEKRKPDDADKDEGPFAGDEKQAKTLNHLRMLSRLKLLKALLKARLNLCQNLLTSLHKQRRQCLKLEILKGHRIKDKTWVILMINPMSRRLQSMTSSRNLKRPLTPDSDWNVRKSVDFRPPQTCHTLNRGLDGIRVSRA
ncbi:hypothetical protein Tco_0299340 [Tanacetum coccineum]